MVAERLSPLDAAFLEIEQGDECSHMHVGWAMIFDPAPGGTPDVRMLRRRIAERIVAMPRFTRRLSAPRSGGLSWPMWEDDPMFDIGAHLRHATLPAPGGDAELLDWLGDFYSHRLDRTRPLWEITLLDGLEADRWALAMKAHHCLIDGVSGSVVTAMLLDSAPDGTPALPIEPAPAPSAAGPGGLIGLARTGVDVMLHPRKLIDMLERSRALAELLRESLVPAADTSLNVPIGAARRMAVVDASLDDFKAIKRSLGGKVNDVALAAAAGGMRDVLLSRGEQPPEQGIRVMVPVSLRGDAEMTSLGNRVSSLFVELPVAEPDPLTRYLKTLEATQALKAGNQAIGTETLLDVAGVTPPVIHATIARASFGARLFNVTITNVPGSPVTLYAFGAPMRRIVPNVPIFANHAVGIAVVSYDGGIAFGLNGDRMAMPDIHVLEHGIERSLEELKRLGSSGSTTRRSAAAWSSSRSATRSQTASSPSR